MVDFEKFRNIIGTGLQEGDYTTWTLKWIKDVPNGLYGPSHDWYIGAQLNDRNNQLLLFWYDSNRDTRFGIYDFSDGTTIHETPADTYSAIPHMKYTDAILYGYSYLCGSVSISLQSYVLMSNERCDGIEVWRGGTSALYIHDITIDEASTIRHGGISPTGKYIIILTNSAKVLCYEGS